MGVHHPCTGFALWTELARCVQISVHSPVLILQTYLAQLGELSEAQARLRSIKVKLDSDWAVSFVLALPRPIVRFLLSEKVRLSRNEMLCFVSDFR